MNTRFLFNSGSGRRVTKSILWCLLLIVAIIALLCWKTGTTPTNPGADDTSTREAEPRFQRAFHRTAARAEASAQAIPAVGTHSIPALTPKPMILEKKVLVASKWNGGPNAFGLDKAPAGAEGATVGPAAVAYNGGKIYVLDNVNQRVLGYDSAGNQVSSATLPSTVASDLSVDRSGSGLAVIDHLNDRVYKVDGNETTLLTSISMRNDFPLGTRFAYDSAASTLSAQDVDADGLATFQGNSLILEPNSPGKLAIHFDKPVACIEQVETDARGIIWVLYTLDGDYRMRRLARIDRQQGTVGVAELDVWFAFDATRHMAPTGDGVVVVAGDEMEGRLIYFGYKGSGD